MANRWGITFLVAFLILVCFTRTEAQQQWPSSKKQLPQNTVQPQNQVPHGQNPQTPVVQIPDQSSGGQNPVKKTSTWHVTQGQNPQNPVGQNTDKYPAGQNPVINSLVLQVHQEQNPQTPVVQIPDKSPQGQNPVKKTTGWQVSQGQNTQNTVGQNVVQNPSKDWPGKGQNQYQNLNVLKDLLASDHSQKQTTNPDTHHPPSHVNSCDVHTNLRVPCGSPDISAASCEALNCCYNGGMCYFGKMVTVQCTKDAQFIVVVARDATLPNIDLDTISLLGDGPSCMSVDSNSAFAIYQFPVTTCGTVVAEEPGMIIYENRMTSSYEVAMGPLSAITRDSSYDLLFQCRYTATSVEALVAEVLQINDPPLSVSALGPISVQMRLGSGQCYSKGCNEADVAYNSYYMPGDYPVTRVLRDPVYVEVQLMDRTDPNLVLNLGRCWTTTSANPHSLPQWDLLIDGCPNKDDRYRSTLVPVGSGSGLDFPSHYRRFIFQMFTFVDPSSLEPQKEQVYIHCSTSVCNAGAGFSCEPNCYNRRKREVKYPAQKQADPRIVVSSGPVQMVSPTV